MTLISKSGFTLLTWLTLTLSVTGQEIILPLETNPALKGVEHKVKKAALADILLELPFLDDFSHDSPYPNESLWADKLAFINNGFALNPPSVGVATLDALNAEGSVYPDATISPQTFIADYLSSHPVNLNLPASDSIYLSFFFQPQGMGLEPKPSDSLCVDFFDTESQLWNNVWRIPGDTLRPFRQVMIPITDERYLKEGFRFRFRNRASLPKNDDYIDKRGNVDHWNIDYVRLGADRTANDTILRDVAFSEPLLSMLKNYESMPWDHFEIGYNTIYLPFVTMNYHNNDSATRNVTRSMSVLDEVWNELYNPDNATAQDISPGNTTTYNIPSIYPFKFNRGDTASYLVKTWLMTDDFDNRSNDTLYRRQVFRDYFAYDDGSAERAYGLNGLPSVNGLVAVRFDSYIPDNLGGVDIYFTQLKDSLNSSFYYKFMVWDDNEGMPGQLIYQDEVDYKVEYSENINQFQRYFFKSQVPVEGIFYVGMMQYREYMLNIGMDINKPANGNLFYNLGSEWQVSEAPGSLMLRPFVLRNYSSVEKAVPAMSHLKVWPNPAKDYIRIDYPDYMNSTDVLIQLYDISGKIAGSWREGIEEIPAGNLSEGIYFLTVRTAGGIVASEKIIIQR